MERNAGEKFLCYGAHTPTAVHTVIQVVVDTNLGVSMRRQAPHEGPHPPCKQYPGWCNLSKGAPLTLPTKAHPIHRQWLECYPPPP